MKRWTMLLAVASVSLGCGGGSEERPEPETLAPAPTFSGAPPTSQEAVAEPSREAPLAEEKPVAAEEKPDYRSKSVDAWIAQLGEENSPEARGEANRADVTR